MPKHFSLKDKAHQKLLLLQASDDFMADVLVLHEKSQEMIDTVEDEDGNSFPYYYKQSPDFEQDIEKLREKYKLSSIHQFPMNRPGAEPRGIGVIEDGKIAQVNYKMPYSILKKSPKNGDFSQLLGC